MATINDLQIINGGKWQGNYAWLFNDKKYNTDTICINGEWVRGLKICDPNYPVIVLSTNNVNERYLRRFLPTLKGAKRVYHKEYTDYDTDPYGNKVARGTISYDIWDLRSLFNVTEDISKFLDYEDNERLKSLTK